ncbi:MAG: glucose-6-phosphate dehydrogenase assembly protein OpcA [Spirochaetales bacterium]
MNRYADPVAVEAELRKNQQEFSPNEARTNLFNLVVYTENFDDVRLIEALNYLHGKRPSRVVVVRRHAGGETRTDVSARCMADANDKVMCIQEIVIYSGDDRAGASPEFWTPLLIRDIPVFVWWLSPLKDAPVPELFDGIADRCFVDTRGVPDAHLFYADFSRKFPSLNTAVSDFSWVRIGPLLKLTANFFNPAEMREKLHDLVSVEFKGGHRSEVELFFQWLKVKLEWQGKSGSTGQTWELTSGQRKVFLKHSDPGTLEHGFELTFVTSKGETCVLKDSKQGFAVAEGVGTSKYTAVFRYLDTGKALVSEVDKNASDRLYLEVMKAWT